MIQTLSKPPTTTHQQAFRTVCEWDVIDGQHSVRYNNLSLAQVLQIPIFEMLFPDANDTKNRRGLRGLLKQFHLEHSARFLHSWIKQKARSSDRSDVCILFDVNNLPVISLLNTVAGELSEMCRVKCVAVDAKLESCISTDFPSVLLTHRFSPKDLKESSRIAKSLRIQLKNHHGTFEKQIQDCSGTPVAIVRKVLMLAYRQCGGIAREYVAIRNLLIQEDTKVVLLASDVHRVGRITIAAAQELHKKTVVIQHGFPIWEYGFLPVVADHFFAWGKFAKEWFINNGTNPNKITVVGNVLCDKQPSRSNGKTDGQKVIFLPNPIELNYNKIAVKGLLSAVEILGCTGFVKMHPSDERRGWYEEQLRNSPYVTLSQDPISKKLIHPGDIVLVGNSGAGIEAVLLGAHIANISMPHMPNPIPYEQYGVGISGELNQTKETILKTAKINLDKYRKGQPAFLEAMLYQLDGRAAQRTAFEIHSLLEATV